MLTHQAIREGDAVSEDGWDPYEVWYTRVLLPRLYAAQHGATNLVEHVAAYRRSDECERKEPIRLTAPERASPRVTSASIGSVRFESRHPFAGRTRPRPGTPREAVPAGGISK